MKVIEASFHQAVRTADGTPETSYNSNSEKVHRKVSMELDAASGFLFCQQSYGSKLVHWAVPAANIVFIVFDNGAFVDSKEIND